MAGGAIRAGRAFVEIFADNTRLIRGLRTAQRRLRNFGGSVRSMGAQLLGIGGIAAAPLAAAVNAASELEETMNKFNVVFGANAAAVKSWGDDFAGQVGRSKAQIADFLASTQDLFVPLGFDPKQATEMSKSVTGLAIDLASFNEKISDQQALDDLQAALTGSGEVMKKYGVVLNEAGVKQELLNMGIDPKRATNAQKAQARYNIILAGTTAAQGDAIRSAGSFANQMKAAHGQVVDLAAAIGGVLLPVVTPLVAWFVQFAATAGRWIAQNKGVVMVVFGVVSALLALGATLLATGIAVGVMAAAVGFLANPVTLLIAAVVAAGAALVHFTDAGGAALEWLKERFAGLLAVVKPVIDGIQNALAAGNLGLAAQIAFGGIEAAFLAGTMTLRGHWHDFSNSLFTIFDVAIGKIRTVWNDAVANIAKGLLMVADWIGLVDSEAAIAIITEDQQRFADDLEGQTQQRIEQRRKEGDAAMAAARQRLAALQDQLVADTKQAAAEAAAAAPAAPTPTAPAATAATTRGIGEGTAAGTFSAIGAVMLGERGGNWRQQQVDHLQVIAENTRATALAGEALNSNLGTA